MQGLKKDGINRGCETQFLFAGVYGRQLTAPVADYGPVSGIYRSASKLGWLFVDRLVRPSVRQAPSQPRATANVG